jgi:hypothetical protein
MEQNERQRIKDKYETEEEFQEIEIEHQPQQQPAL